MPVVTSVRDGCVDFTSVTGKWKGGPEGPGREGWGKQVSQGSHVKMLQCDLRPEGTEPQGEQPPPVPGSLLKAGELGWQMGQK